MGRKQTYPIVEFNHFIHFSTLGEVTSVYQNIAKWYIEFDVVG
jgi:hypothetical protein